MGRKVLDCVIAPEQEQVMSRPPRGGSSRIAAAFSERYFRVARSRLFRFGASSAGSRL